MNILLLGAQGQVGFELQRSLASLGQITACDRSIVDLENLTQLESLIYKIKPQIIVNAAAYTQVDQAQTDEVRAHKINAQAPEVMAQIARDLNAWLIHYSTDYVFDGKKSTSYNETDQINPLSVYGQTKAAGEESVRHSGCRHLILRTSWVYAQRGRNFARTMLKLAQEREALKVVGDQIGVPTSAELIADISAFLLYRINWDPMLHDFKGGTFHLTATGATSWFDFAYYLIQGAMAKGLPIKVALDKIEKITTAEYPTKAHRPANSVLNTQKIAQQFGIQLPVWQVHADRVLTQLCSEPLL